MPLKKITKSLDIIPKIDLIAKIQRDRYLKLLPTIKIYSLESDNYRYYQPAKKRLVELLNSSPNIDLGNSKERNRLLDIIFKPVNFKNIQFFVYKVDYTKTYWGLYNGTEEKIKLVKNTTNHNFEAQEMEILDPKKFCTYNYGDAILMPDGTIFYLENHNPEILFNLANPVGFDNQGRIIQENKNLALLEKEGFKDNNTFLVYDAYNFQINDYLQKVNDEEPTLNKRTIVINVKLKNYLEFMFINKVRYREALAFVECLYFAAEQLFSDFFSKRESGVTSTRRVIRLGDRLVFGIDVNTNENREIARRLSRFIEMYQSIFNSITTLRAGIHPNLNNYFRNIIINSRRIKIESRDILSADFTVTSMPIEDRFLRTLYQQRVELGRQPNREVLPNSAAYVLSETIKSKMKESNSNIFIEELTAKLLLPNQLEEQKVYEANMRLNEINEDLVVKYFKFQEHILNEKR
jgi:hypothetical protein